jgi:hypothetical protein
MPFSRVDQEFLAISTMALLCNNFDGIGEVGERAAFECFRSLDRDEREEGVRSFVMIMYI